MLVKYTRLGSDTVPTCRAQFWKGTSQGLLWPGLIPVGQVVSEEKIFECGNKRGHNGPWMISFKIVSGGSEYDPRRAPVGSLV
jgi:hypothetical protein